MRHYQKISFSLKKIQPRYKSQLLFIDLQGSVVPKYTFCPLSMMSSTVGTLQIHYTQIERTLHAIIAILDQSLEQYQCLEE